jgi:hypothetical protein
LSGNGNNGTLTNGPTYSSANGGSIVFNGSSGYVSLGDPTNLRFGTGDWTFECFVKPNNIQMGGGDGVMIISKTYDLGFEAFWYTSVFNTWIAGSNYTYSPSAGWSNGSWYHLVFSKASGVYTFYQNAITSGQSTNSGNISATGSPWNIGKRSGSAGYLNGNISIIRMYNRALSTSEVSQNYNALKSRYIAAPAIPASTAPSIVTSGLVLNLDAANAESYSGSGTTWNDLSGNGNNGTLVNSPTYSSANSGKLVFNGSNYVTVSSLNLSTTNHTIIAVARYTGASNQRIISGGSNWLMGWWSGNTNQYYPNGAFVSSGGGGAETSWIFYAAVGDYSADSWTLYRNGITIVAGPNSNGSNGPNGLTIGGGLGENSACEVGVVLAYNRVLTTAEITQNFEILRGRYGL